jgi:hypothetical protein
MAHTRTEDHGPHTRGFTSMRWSRPLMAGAPSQPGHLAGHGVLDAIEQEWGTTTYPGGVTYRAVRFTLTVHVEGRDPYAATTVQRLREDTLNTLQPGMTLSVLVDAADHSRVAVAL